jgi:hypothetical protein
VVVAADQQAYHVGVGRLAGGEPPGRRRVVEVRQRTRPPHRLGLVAGAQDGERAGVPRHGDHAHRASSAAGGVER